MVPPHVMIYTLAFDVGIPQFLKRRSLFINAQYIKDVSSNTVDVLDSSSCGYCVDHSPDKVVGTAMENLLVSSQDVAFDKDLLHSLDVTYILNVGHTLENAFPQVECTHTIVLSLCFMLCMPTELYPNR